MVKEEINVGQYRRIFMTKIEENNGANKDKFCSQYNRRVSTYYIFIKHSVPR